MLDQTDRRSGRTPTLAYVIGSYPLLTTTFIDREIELLRRRGVDPEIVSLRRPDRMLSPEQEKLEVGVEYVLPVSVGALIGSHLRFLVSRPIVFWKLLFGLLGKSHPSPKARLRTLYHFGEGVRVADLIARRPVRVEHLHAHFVDRAAMVALVASRLLDVSYSATAHANDIYVNPVLLETKVQQARFVATCTDYNRAHLIEAVGPSAADKVLCIYHGIDAGRYRPDRSGRQAPPLLVAVGQLKEKKGFSYLIEACAKLHERGYRFSCQIIGEGPLRPQLEAEIRRRSLGGVVTLRGALSHDEVVAAYRSASVFALAPVVAHDGDRDGIPNVILEAMAMELPVVSTRHSGIPEAVEDEGSGILVPPGDVDALVDALATLLDDGDLMERYGEAGRRIVLERFDVVANVAELQEQLTA